MYTKIDEQARGIQEEFIEAVHESIHHHVAGVLKHVPTEEIDKADFEYTTGMLTNYVVKDVKALGLQFMCVPHIFGVVQNSIAGILERQMEVMDGEAENDS